jgi:hypothetical protein
LIGGEYVMVEDYFIDAVKSGIKITGLTNTLNHCEVKASTLGRYLGSKAEACMFLKACDMTDF